MKVGIVNGFDVYEHRLDLLYQYFKNRGHDVNVYTTNYLHREKKYRTDLNSSYNYINAEIYKKNMSFARLKSHYNLAKSIFSSLPSDLDLLWVIVPPNSFVARTAEFKKLYPNTKVIVDILDMWPETLPVGKIKTLFPFNLWKKIRNDNLDDMDYIVTECNLFQEKINHIVDSKKCSTLYLSYKDIDEIETIKGLLPADRLSLCYLGSVNNIIDIDCIKEIIKNTTKIQKVELHIIGGGEKEAELIFEAENAGAKVINHGKIYDDEYKKQIFNSCHYGLNIMKKSVYVGLTMKSIDYLKAGLPIINNIAGDTWEFVEQDGIGINTNNGEIDISFLDYDLNGKTNVKNFYMQHFSEETFNNNLTEIIKKVTEI
ncbi:glycosyltransferase [Streptococcus porcinus]|uniref:Capsular polysaccharide biosynthesis protein Cps4F n=1 Tax=Streptococcus porcinus TaxID=1340 RepID=A0A4V0HA57_STRPO|nr:glycosyltransferase [Streptococcus porcinus]VTT43212.1 capsular polysaccharide biosynthesis protein Cps4F [Streptococcus porcinus]VTT44713.1 capsular polysaccharide biosynthesis protein Cps4F [Streptococcus porcinus]